MKVLHVEDDAALQITLKRSFEEGRLAGPVAVLRLPLPDNPA